MKYLLDTCVLGELRHPKCSPSVRAFADNIPGEAIFISVITFGEIVQGIALMPASKKKAQLSHWLAGLKQQFADQLLNIDGETAEIWGEIAARLQNKGITLPMADGFIAATALKYGLCVATRNTKDFVATGVRVVDPWKAA